MGQLIGRLGETRLAEPDGPDLVRLAQAGEVEALAALYDQHVGAIFRYLWARLGDRQLVEDLTAEVFQRMLTALPRYRARGVPFRAWLFRIARNLLFDHYRRAGQGAAVAWEDTRQPPDSEGDPAAMIEHTLALEKAFRALAELEAAQREVLTLRFVSGLSLRETALAVGKSEDAVKALQRRGLAGLRLAVTSDVE